MFQPYLIIIFTHPFFCILNLHKCNKNWKSSALFNQRYSVVNNYDKHTTRIYELNWEKGKPSGSIACMRQEQPRFYWSCLSVVMKDATPLTPLAHEQNSIFQCEQHTIHDPRGQEKPDRASNSRSYIQSRPSLPKTYRRQMKRIVYVQKKNCLRA